MNEDFKIGIAIAICCSPITSPKEPVAFLYGTPSEIGNIGLRNGDSVTLYDGAVFPPLPEWDKETYPYAFIDISVSPLLTLCKYRPHARLRTDGSTAIATFGEQPQAGDILGYNIVNGKWELVWTAFSNHYVYEEDFVWCDTDIYYKEESGGALYRATTAPIPVSGIVGYSYNGTVLPPLPEWDKEAYPYAFLFYQRFVTPHWELVVIPEAIYKKSTNGDWCLYVEAGSAIGWNISSDSQGNPQGDEWLTRETAWHGYVQPSNLQWANFNVLSEDGTVYQEASDPIPIYE